jgi:hypothetical protein
MTETIEPEIEVIKAEETTQVQNLLQPRISIDSMNRKARRGMRLPLTMWGCYNELGFLMTAGTFAKVSEWANNHRVMRNPDQPPHKNKNQRTPEDEQVQDNTGKLWIPRKLSVRPIMLLAKDAFKSPIKLTETPFDLKTIKK